MIFAERFRYSDRFVRKCSETFDTALSEAPFYMRLRGSIPGGSTSTEERYDSLPPLTKADMRACFPYGLVPVGKNIEKGLSDGEIEYTFTSGTTSEKVVNIFCQDWWNRSESASWKLNGTLAGMEYPQRQAKLASSLNVGICCEEDLPMSHRILGDTLYLNEKTSVLQWLPRHLDRMIDELGIFRPAILEANPSLLARLAWRALDTGREVFSPKAIVFTFEYPSALHLEAIRRVFSSAFVSSYGSTETGFVMEQGSDGLMHQNTEFCRIDFRPFKERFGGPELGRIYVTKFGDPWNCILKFDVGDIVRLAPDAGGSDGMAAVAIEGRVSNVTFSPDGGLVTTGRLDSALAAVGGLRDYRLEQTGAGKYILEAIPEPGACGACLKDALSDALRGVYGAGDFAIRLTDAIMPGPAGKFRRTQTDFDFDETELFV